MLPSSLCFLDLETTGTSATYGRIIDIGIIKVEEGQVVAEYNQLVNPERGVDPFISQMTGITLDMLENAPTFAEVRNEVLEFLADSVLVAHNVRFDYSFLRNEFKRYDISFSSKHFDSIKLARALFPKLRRYNLDSIISNFRIECKNRHRAYDDAKVIWDFFQVAQKTSGQKLFESAINHALKKPSLPINLNDQDLENLPETSGVYIFYGENNFPLYIGKSVNIRDRVLSHFSNDHLSATDLQISQEIRSIETIQTSGELGALLLESTLIKKHQPLYNRLLRYARKMTILIRSTDKSGYNTVEIKEVDQVSLEESEKLLGIFRSRKQMVEKLYNLAKEKKLCPKLLGLDKARSHCFYYDLGICPGACKGKELNIKYNIRFEEAFFKYKIKQWKFDGPIVLREKGEQEEVFVIDKWCLLGSAKNEDGLENLSKEYTFDLDTYKILTKFILKPTKRLSITPFLTNHLQFINN